MPFDAGLESWVSPEDLYSKTLKWTSCCCIIYFSISYLKEFWETGVFTSIRQAETEVQRIIFLKSQGWWELSRFNTLNPSIDDSQSLALFLSWATLQQKVFDNRRYEWYMDRVGDQLTFQREQTWTTRLIWFSITVEQITFNFSGLK